MQSSFERLHETHALVVYRIRIVTPSFMIFPNSRLKEHYSTLRHIRGCRIIRLAPVAPIVVQLARERTHRAGTAGAARDLRRDLPEHLCRNRPDGSRIRADKIHSKRQNLLAERRRQLGDVREMVATFEIHCDILERALIEHVAAISQVDSKREYGPARGEHVEVNGHVAGASFAPGVDRWRAKLEPDLTMRCQPEHSSVHVGCVIEILVSVEIERDLHVSDAEGLIPSSCRKYGSLAARDLRRVADADARRASRASPCSDARTPCTLGGALQKAPQRKPKRITITPQPRSSARLVSSSGRFSRQRPNLDWVLVLIAQGVVKKAAVLPKLGQLRPHAAEVSPGP